MKLPLQITYRHLTPSDSLDALIREKATALETFYDSIMRCRVLVEREQRHHPQDGNRFRIRVDLTVPGDEIVVTHEPTLYPALRDIGAAEVTKASDIDSVLTHAAVAVREAFDIARRQLQDFARRQRVDVKVHEGTLHGKVLRLGPEEGWIRTPEDREVYFHENSVLEGAFKRLDVGSEVAFVEERGEKGPQASSVRLLGKHHYQ